MTITAIQLFSASLSQATPPVGSSIYLQAMWYDARGDWHKAHSLVDSLTDITACHIHAYLHRKEGDQGNAAYWYSRAAKPMPRISLQEEWEQLVKTLL
jgi:hypothetical protein